VKNLRSLGSSRLILADPGRATYTLLPDSSYWLLPPRFTAEQLAELYYHLDLGNPEMYFPADPGLPEAIAHTSREAASTSAKTAPQDLGALKFRDTKNLGSSLKFSEHPENPNKTGTLAVQQTYKFPSSTCSFRSLENKETNKQTYKPGAPENFGSRPEQPLLADLLDLLGPSEMAHSGGNWRLAIRRNAGAVRAAISCLRERLKRHDLDQLRNPGGWAWDQFLRFARERDLPARVTSVRATPAPEAPGR